MKPFGVACILLFMAAVFPEPQVNSLDIAWSLGLLIALALVGQQLSRALGIPAVVGWMAAGFLMGEGGLRAIIPAESNSVEILYTVAAVWVGFLTGLRFKWKKEHQGTSFIWVVPILTIVSVITFAGGLILIADLSSVAAIALSSVAMIWGPIVSSTLTENSEIVLLTTLGLCFSIIMVSFAVFFGVQQDAIITGANSFLFRLWISVAVGSGFAAILFWSRLLEHQTTAIASTGCGLILMAFLIFDLQLFPLIVGLSVGIFLALQNSSNYYLQNILKPKLSLAALAFFSLFGASINPLQLLIDIPPGLIEILLLQLLLLIALRVVAPSIWCRMPWDQPGYARRISLILLPHGAILYEIGVRPGGMFELFDLPFSQFAGQIVIANVILYTVILSIVAVIFERSGERKRNLSHHPQFSESPAAPSVPGPS